MNKFNIAVIGATGSVGRLFVTLLEEKSYLIRNIFLFASKDSLGKEINFHEKKLKIQDLSQIDFQDLDIVFFCTNSDIVKKYYKSAIQNSCIIIDKSSLFRLDPNIPLLIPEINFNLIQDSFSRNMIISNPNCCVIILSLVLFPLHKIFKIKRLVISTYQSVSGAGNDALDELFNQTRSKLSFSEIDIKSFPFQIAFNIIPFIGKIDDTGNCEEESKIKEEIQKIISTDIKISVTSVRVPVFISHSMSVNIEFWENFGNISSIKDILYNAPSIEVIEDENDCTPIFVANKENIFVSRIRVDESQANSINLWISGDNLKKGAALNAIQILEKISKIY
ncbi:MAG: aspartate-semialdehyde dehydrogenase [Rickettsia sp.]|nr:aspartate-semialdehyde dehydrogenase [Rickettsia sp.]